MKHTSAARHHDFSHDSITDLGYDFTRLGDPGIEPKHPFRVYLPRSAEDVAHAVRESAALGAPLVVRGSGHSGNDLVLSDGGSLVVMRLLDRILDIRHDIPSVTVEAGALLVEVDHALAETGLGLPIVGDHRHITAGGFASVGGVSPASHLFGLFVDNVRAIDYVTPDGELAHCDHNTDGAQLRRLLTGCGRHGIMVRLELQAIHIDKSRHRLVNDGRVFRDIDRFVEYGLEIMADVDSGRMQRGYWMDLSDRNRAPRFGQWSNYQTDAGARYRPLRRKLSQSTRNAWGNSMSAVPDRLGHAAKTISGVAVIFPPTHQTLQDAETMADAVLDYSVGDPVRWFAAWTPMSKYTSTFHRIYQLFRRYRSETGCFTSISVLTQAIRSPYLNPNSGGEPHCAVMMICGVRPPQLTDDIRARLIEELDDICLDEGALRYLHTPTSKDPVKLARLDPNTLHQPAAHRLRLVDRGMVAVQPNGHQ